MLVSEAKAKRMYNKEGWLYKSFSLFFKNDLWDKQIPKGFPICPYFWMALFTGLILNPFFLFPVGKVVLPICKWISKNILGSFDHWFYNLFPLDEGSYTPGLGVMALLLCILIGIVCISISILLIATFQWFSAIGLLGYLIFWVGLLTIPFVGVRLYIDSKSHSCDSKHWMYTALYAVVVLGLFLVLQPTALLVGVASIFSVVWHVVTSIFLIFGIILGWLWIAICWCAGFVATFFSAAWPAIKTVGVFVIVLLLGTSILGLLGLTVAKFTPAPKIINDKFDDIKPVARRYDFQWKRQLLNMLNNKSPYVTERILESNQFLKVLEELQKTLNMEGRGNIYTFATEFKNKIGVSLINQYLDFDKLDELMYTNPKKFKELSDFYNDTTTVQFVAYIDEIFIEIFRDSREAFHYDELSSNLKIILNELKNDVETHKQIQERYKRKAVRDDKIEKFCGGLIRSISPIGVGITKIGYAFKYLWEVVWGWVKRFGRGILDILSVGWELVKKGKKETCPYFQFTDGVQEDENSESEDPK